MSKSTDMYMDEQERMGNYDEIENEFICPKCGKKNNQERDDNLTDGQESEWMAGFRLCSKCAWYGQPKEVLDGLRKEGENEDINYYHHYDVNNFKKWVKTQKCIRCEKNSLKYFIQTNQIKCEECNKIQHVTGRCVMRAVRKEMGVDNNIYFAGKISHSDWREDILGNTEKVNKNIGRHDYWGVWDEEKKGEYFSFYDDKLTYTGPFFTSCDHGCSHGESTHGAGENACIEDNQPTQKDIFNGCIEQIGDSDYIFCWIDSLDCYGTLFELGVAHEQGKKIFIGIDEKLQQICECNTHIDDAMNHGGKCWGCHSIIKSSDDLWFVKQSGESNYYVNHKDAWNAFLDWGPMKISKEDKDDFVKTLNTQELEDYEDIKNKQPMSKTINYFKRNRKIVDELKKLYNGKCQICQDTFEKVNGENYCETHHVKALGKNGTDTIDNLVVLCPTCHKKLHFGKEKEFDIKYKEEHYKLMEEVE